MTSAPLVRPDELPVRRAPGRVPKHRGGRRHLGRRASFGTAVTVAGVCLWGSAAPSTSYPLYAAHWHLSPLATTSLFAVYPLALVPVLLVFGQVSDHVGRRATMLAGGALLLVGALAFAVAPLVGWVFAGRALMGAGVGLALTPATAAAVEFSTAGRTEHASSMTTASTAVGLALATVVGGGLIQYAPFPLHLDYWVLVAVTVVVLGFVWRLPRHTRDEARGPWRPRPVTVPRETRPAYLLATAAVTTAFAYGAVFLALGADIAEQLIGTSNLLVIGLLLAVTSLMIGVSAIGARRYAPRALIAAGGVLTLVDLALLELSAHTHSLGLFVLTTVLSGTAYGLLFSGGLALISRRAPEHHRGGTISAVYLVAYILQGAIAVGLGVVTTGHGLGTGLLLGTLVIGALAVLVAGLAITYAAERK